jgi:hypothetical protein
MSATLTPSPAPTPTTIDGDPTRLGDYRDDRGGRRMLVARRSPDGGLLVIDQDADRLTDRRLVARLGADEPTVNAAIVAELYLSDPAGRFARPLDDRDWDLPSDGTESPQGLDDPDVPGARELRDTRGRRYRLGVVDEHRYGRQTRWLRRGARGRAQAVTLRAVVGALEAYDPARTMTRAAIARPPRDAGTGLLVDELRTIVRSRLVLNRALREEVHRRVRAGDLSLSCIASRCGRGKHRSTGLRVGDTSWLQRRLGVLPEAGAAQPTPWIHTDVLALIAREGLGVEPREVELA